MQYSINRDWALDVYANEGNAKQESPSSKSSQLTQKDQGWLLGRKSRKEGTVPTRYSSLNWAMCEMLDT